MSEGVYLALGAGAIGAVDPNILGNNRATLIELEERLELGAM